MITIFIGVVRHVIRIDSHRSLGRVVRGSGMSFIRYHVEKMEAGVRIFVGLQTKWISLNLSKYIMVKFFSKNVAFIWHFNYLSGIRTQINLLCGVCQSTVVRPTTSSVLHSPLCLSRLAKTPRRFSSSVGGSAVEETQPLVVHERCKRRPSLLEHSPLTNQTWRQFLTSDEKMIVCVHPVKPVEFRDTKVCVFYY